MNTNVKGLWEDGSLFRSPLEMCYIKKVKQDFKE